MRALMLTAILGIACGDTCDLEKADREYMEIMVEYQTAHRDVTRNVHNRDARRRKQAAERARVEFFRDPRLTEAIQEAREEPAGTRLRALGDAWWRQSLVVRSWTREEKNRETEILARLDGVAGREATWSPPGQGLQVPLGGKWDTVSRQADNLSPELRGALAQEYVDHHMEAVNEDLRLLVELRNEVAEREGFPTWWHLALTRSDITEEQLSQATAALEPTLAALCQTRRARLAQSAEELGIEDSFVNEPLLARRAGIERGRDDAEPYFDTDRAEGKILTSLREMGVDLDGWQVYVGPGRYTRKGAYSFPIRPPDRLALVISLDRRYDIWHYEALIHEAAHAFRWRSLSQEVVSSPVLWDPPPAFTEGLAQMFERLLVSSAWTSRYLPEMPEETGAALEEWRRGELMRSVAEYLVKTEVERLLYETPDQLAQVAGRCAELERAIGLTSGEVITTTDGVPYCRALHSQLMWHYPGYNQNYIFAFMLEARLHAALVEAVGEPLENPAAGPWLVENVLGDAALNPYYERVDALAPGEPWGALVSYLEGPAVARGAR